MDQTTPNIGGPTMMGVVASVLAVMCKRVQQLLTMLGHAVHRGEDTTHNAWETRCNAHAWPQECWKSSANGNIVALSFGDQGTKKNWGVVGSNVWPGSNFAQQFPTTRNNKQQHATECANGRVPPLPDFLWLTWTRDSETRTCVLSLWAEDSVHVLIVDFSTGRNK